VSLRPNWVTLGSAEQSCSARMHSWRRRTPMSAEALGPAPARLIGRLLSLLSNGWKALLVAGCCPSPAPGPNWRIELGRRAFEEDSRRVQSCCEGAESLPQLSAIARAMAVDPQYVCGAVPDRRTSRAQPRQNTLPEEACTRTYTAGTKHKIRSQGTSIS
jgi:hypothetical protein